MQSRAVIPLVEGSIVSIVNARHWMAWVRISVGQWIFLFCQICGRAVGPTQTLLNGYYGYWVGIKQLRCDMNLSPPSSAEVKNEWSYTSASCICLKGVDRDSCIFDLLNRGLAHGNACTCTRYCKQKGADVHVPSGIQTNDPSV